MSNLSIKERPILFSGPMVRAILDGSKTQTRRVIKPQPVMYEEGQCVHVSDLINDSLKCPYGIVGDQIWVRETWMPDAPQDGTWADTQFYGCRMSPLSDIPEKFRKPKHCIYKATWSSSELVGWKPSIHMPRWASRIQLEITGVRVERLQDITEQDCRAEGAIGGHGSIPGYSFSATPLEHFQHIWKSTGGDWDANPWVWAIEFRRVAP